MLSTSGAVTAKSAAVVPTLNGQGRLEIRPGRDQGLLAHQAGVRLARRTARPGAGREGQGHVEVRGGGVRVAHRRLHDHRRRREDGEPRAHLSERKGLPARLGRARGPRARPLGKGRDQQDRRRAARRHRAARRSARSRSRTSAGPTTRPRVELDQADAGGDRRRVPGQRQGLEAPRQEARPGHGRGDPGRARRPARRRRQQEKEQ